MGRDRNNLKLYGKDYYQYLELLSAGNTYSILISKRLLIRPIIPVWVCVFLLFLVRNSVFFFAVGLPSLMVFAVFLWVCFPAWRACNISPKAYLCFHIFMLFALKIVSVPIS